MMSTLALLMTHSAYLWYLLPLAAVVSLVYSASRYELPERILRRAGRLFVTILLFMGAVFLILWAFSIGL